MAAGLVHECLTRGICVFPSPAPALQDRRQGHPRVPGADKSDGFAASVQVDIRLHTGEWTPAQAMDFYASAGFAPARIAAEITRNAMLPGTRLMYWLGITAIRDLRRRWRGSTVDFHDALIGHGHVPIAWVADEMARAGLLN